MPAGGSCLLASINYSAYVENPFTENASFNFDEFKEDVAILVREMNVLLDEGLPLHPLQEQRDSVRDWRQIGIGVMGVADMFIKLGIVYGSEESLQLLDKIESVKFNTGVTASALLAKEQSPYPKWNGNLANMIYGCDEETIKLVELYGLRNSQIFTAAPTGSISTMLGVSGGIEPIFALSYTRKTESIDNKDTYYTVNTKIVDEYISTTKSEKLPECFITSYEINPINRVKIQSVFQKYTDASISSTVNLPEKTTIEDIENIYMNAYKYGLKGITVFRENCKRTGILTIDTTKSTNTNIKRPESIPCDIHNVKIEGQRWTIIIGLLNNLPYEVFAFKNRNIHIKEVNNALLIKTKTEKNTNLYSIRSNNLDIVDLPSMYETGEEEFITRLISRLIRLGEINTVIKDAEKTYKNIGTFVNVIKRILSKYATINDKENKCPECGGELIKEEGCEKCNNCGYSKCG